MMTVEEKAERLIDEMRLLIGLQKTDTQLLELRSKSEEIPKKVVALQSFFQKLKDRFEERRSEYENLKRIKKEREIELDEGLERLKKLKARVSEIKTNKEYQAHLKEIEAAQKEIREIEDSILFAMESLENGYKVLTAEEKVYAEEERRFENEKNTLMVESEKIENEMLELKERRKEIASRLMPALYEDYSKILKLGKGLAVVEARGGSCTGCHMSLPPQLFNDVRKREEIIRCSNCQRILYYRDSVLMGDNQVPK